MHHQFCLEQNSIDKMWCQEMAAGTASTAVIADEEEQSVPRKSDMRGAFVLDLEIDLHRCPTLCMDGMVSVGRSLAQEDCAQFTWDRILNGPVENSFANPYGTPVNHEMGVVKLFSLREAELEDEVEDRDQAPGETGNKLSLLKKRKLRKNTQGTIGKGGSNLSLVSMGSQCSLVSAVSSNPSSSTHFGGEPGTDRTETSSPMSPDVSFCLQGEECVIQVVSCVDEEEENDEIEEISNNNDNNNDEVSEVLTPVLPFQQLWARASSAPGFHTDTSVLAVVGDSSKERIIRNVINSKENVATIKVQEGDPVPSFVHFLKSV